MRLLGIDYGTKRIGIALTDESGTMAFPHTTLRNDADILATLVELVRVEGVHGIVVGRSHALDGTPNRIQKEIDAFTKMLRDTLAIPVELELEQFSTQAALRIQGRTKHTDASAAALILEAYLAKKRTVENNHTTA